MAGGSSQHDKENEKINIDLIKVYFRFRRGVEVQAGWLAVSTDIP